MKITTRLLFASITAVLAAALSACSESGGSGDVVGLQMPTKLSVVAAQDDGATAGGVMAGVVASPLPDASTDYGMDPTQTWVYDASIEPLSMVNEILCYVGQIRTEEMVNQGAYYALVNANECQQSSSGNSTDASGGASGGVSSGDSSQATKYEKWLVESTRASNLLPQIVRIWVPPSGQSSDPMDNQYILVHVTVNEGVSSTNPFGKFTLNFKGVLPAGTVMPDSSVLGADTTVMTGTLKTVDRTDNKAQFTFINLGGGAVTAGLPFDMIQKSNVIMDDAAGNSGIAQTYQYDQWGPNPADTSKYFVSFDATAFLRGTDIDNNNVIDTNSEVCADRTQFDTHVWRYNLYNPTTGARITRSSNMPFVTSGNVFGNIGYWGLWLEDDTVTLTDGETITKQNWGSSAPAETYTVGISGGRLIKRTRDTATLTSLAGAQFQWYGDHTDPFCQAATPCPNQAEYMVTVNTGGNAVVQSKVTWNPDSPPTYDTSMANTMLNVQAEPLGTQLWLWSSSLGGNVILPSGGGTPPTTLTFFKEENVSATSATALTLYCYDRCIKGGISNPASEADLFYPGDGTTYTYTLSVSGGKYALADNTNAGAAVTIANGTDLSSITDGGGNPVDWYQWGVQSSEMVTSAVANPWEVYDQPVSYRWETGPNNWNRQYSVQNTSTSAYVTFDPPLQFAYSYDAGDDPNIGAAVTSHPAGNFHMLEYGGPGELWGFPWTQDATTGHGYSTLTLKNGVVLTDALTNQYIVKQLEREQTMQEDTNPVTVCDTAGLSLSTAVNSSELALPAAVEGDVPFTVSDQSALSPDSAPAVIEGELQ